MQNKPVIIEKAAAKPARIFYVLDLTATHEFIWEIDGYCIRDGKTGRDLWTLQVECPKCRQNLTIDCTKKKVEVTSDALYVEPFACTHHGDFGQIFCGFKAAIEPPKGSNKFSEDQHGRKIKIDGVFKRI